MSIEKEPYQLVVRYNIDAIDGLQAKEMAKKFIDGHNLDCNDCELKLQKIEKDKPPTGIKIPFLKNE